MKNYRRIDESIQLLHINGVRDANEEFHDCIEMLKRLETAMLDYNTIGEPETSAEHGKRLFARDVINYIVTGESFLKTDRHKRILHDMGY